MNEVILYTPRRIGDERGWFSETYNSHREAKLGITDTFVQDNKSYSKNIGTVRGIHFQRTPHAQAKLVSCTRGSLIDFVVDLRRGSPTYGKHVSAHLSADNGRQIYIPVGFGHGFVTLQESTEISYKVSDYYSAELDGGIRWNSPGLAIEWPVDEQAATLSDKDRLLPLLNEFESCFEYLGTPLSLKVVD